MRLPTVNWHRMSVAINLLDRIESFRVNSHQWRAETLPVAEFNDKLNRFCEINVTYVLNMRHTRTYVI